MADDKRKHEVGGLIFDLDEDGRVSVPIAPDLSYQKKRKTFQSPSTTAHGDFDPQAHVGQRFEIIGVNFGIHLLQDGGGGPLFTIRFEDGYEIDSAREEEVFEDGGWNPPF